MQTKIEFGFGIGEDADGKPISPEEAASGILKICQRASELFGGYTMARTTGGWTNPEGRLVEEQGCTIFVFGSVERNLNGAVLAFVDCIKEHLRQQAVCVTLTEVHTRIV